MLRATLARWTARSERFWDLVVARHGATPRAARQGLRVERLEERVQPSGRPLPFPVIAAGAGPGGTGAVTLTDALDGRTLHAWTPFPDAPLAGTRLAVGDLTGDGYPDVVAAAGPGGGPRVRAFDGKSGLPLAGPLADFFAFEPGFRGGVQVAVGDVRGKGYSDLIAAADAGGGPRVRVFDGKTGAVVADFWAFEPGFTGGVRLAVGNFAGGKANQLAVAAGPGGGPRVRVLDLATMAPVPGPLGDSWAFDPSFAGGVSVAAGDVTGDGRADLVAGAGAGGGPRVRVFDGASGKVARDFLAFDGSARGGVQVGAAFVDDDANADVVAASGQGEAPRVRVFSGATGQRLAGPVGDFDPGVGAGAFGVGVAAGNDPPAYVPPVITVTRLRDAAESGNPPPASARGAFRFKLDSPFTGADPDYPGLEIIFKIAFGGTATPPLYSPPPGYPSDYSADNPQPDNTSTGFFMAGTDTFDLNIYAVDDLLVEGPESVTATALPWFPTYPRFTVGTPATATLTIIDNDRPPERYPTNQASGGLASAASEAGGSSLLSKSNCDGAQAGAVRATGAGGVGLGDGVIAVPGTRLSSGGFGGGWGQSPSWGNGAGLPAGGGVGNGWATTEQPRIYNGDAGLAVVLNSATRFYYDAVPGVRDALGFYPSYAPRPYAAGVVTASGHSQFALDDGAGNALTFFGFGDDIPLAQQGSLKSRTEPGGTVTQVTASDPLGRPSEVRRSAPAAGGTVTESYLTAYGAGGGPAASVTLRRQVGTGPWQTVRRVAYDYYAAGGADGSAGDLRLATVTDAAGGVLEQAYYRYGPGGLMKSAFNAAAYARLKGDLGLTDAAAAAASDAALAPYADVALEYDLQRRVTKAVLSGAGCSACTGGQGTYLYAYATGTTSTDFNAWRTRTAETLPTGDTRVTYTNGYGEAMLTSFQPAGGAPHYDTFYRYEAGGGVGSGSGSGSGTPAPGGRLVLTAAPSAVTGYDDAYPDLVRYVGGNAQYLSDSAGLIETRAYGASTTATDSAAGSAAGFLAATAVRQGEAGADVPQQSWTYFRRAYGGATTTPVATDTVYRNADGTGAQVTTTAYAWYVNTIQPQVVTVTRPAVAVAQNGPGVATSTATAYDLNGRAAWSKDAGGFLSYREYDVATGAAVKSIGDVDTAQTGTFANLPAGWATPAGGGRHQTTVMEVDDQGRATKVTDPLGRVGYAVYNDANHESRSYPAWDAAAGRPTGPTAVSRDDRAGGYAESLTMSAAPHLTAGRPDGTEAVANLESLSRSYRNAAGQTVSTAAYFRVAGLAYSTAPALGVEGTDFDRATQDYDKLGRPNRTRSAAGTVTRTYSDGQGRAVSQWVGTNDTPATGFWSPSNPAGMAKVREFEYDGGGAGDGNRTKVTDFPGGGAAPRVTQTWFDWRDRPVAVKAGVEAAESASVNRPLSYADYDNLGEVVTTRLYDGDAVTLTTTNGVPVAPAAGLLRAQSATAYDELGRVYQGQTFGVDPATGAVSAAALTSSTWFDLRGNAVKTLAPGGLVRKSAFDGLGRTVASYATDGGGDPAPGAAGGWAAALDVAGDAVLSQSESTYDANGNVVLSTRRERFHDEAATGALGTPTMAPKARVSYSATYYDLADRATDAVEVGTNGGAVYARPATVPARSDAALVSSVSYDAAGRAFEATDPRGLKSRTTYDARGRTLKTVENYVDGVPSSLDDKTTDYAYGPAGMTSLTARLAGGGGQTTQWVYGVTAATGSGIDSNDAKGATRWPDPATGAASASQQQTLTVNALGQPLTATDRNGTAHAVSYDILGRVTDDAVTLLGVNVDGAVRRVHADYDGQGNAYLLTNYSAATGGAVVSQVQRAFNGLGQLTAEYQAHGALVATATTPKVQYAYSALDATNKSRPVSVTYPNGRVVASDYGTAGQLNDTVSRLAALKDGATTLEGYAYLGLGTVVTRSHPQPGLDLTYVKRSGEAVGDAGDPYTGIDRFGRVVDQRWVVAATGVASDRFGYTYDRSGNRLTKSNGVNAAFGEAYSYDGLNQLANFVRGVHTQSWNYDALGNWSGVTTDGTTQTRTANAQNEVTAISGAVTPTYDANGNMTADETGRQFVYDAWNRLKVVKSSSGVVLETLGYDALSRRITSLAGGAAKDLYYSPGWQVLEERVGGVAKASYVWSPVYVDSLIAQDRDADGSSANGLEERLYALADANYNVTALVSVTGVVVERYAYDPFGKVSVLDAGFGGKAGGTGYGWVVLFQGLRRDGVSGLDYARNRDYSATLGRWVTMDPIGFAAGDNNLYNFEGSNSPNAVDPSGLDKWYYDPKSGGCNKNATGEGMYPTIPPNPNADRNSRLRAQARQWREEGMVYAANLLDHWLNQHGKDASHVATGQELDNIKKESSNAINHLVSIFFNQNPQYAYNPRNCKDFDVVIKKQHIHFFSPTSIAGQGYDYKKRNFEGRLTFRSNELFYAFGGVDVEITLHGRCRPWKNNQVGYPGMDITADVVFTDSYAYPHQWPRHAWQSYADADALQQSGNLPFDTKASFTVNIDHPFGSYVP